MAAFLIAGILWYFADRRHRWPRWALLILLVLGVGSLISSLDKPSFLAVLDLAALAVLLRGWPASRGRAARVSPYPGSGSDVVEDRPCATTLRNCRHWAPTWRPAGSFRWPPTCGLGYPHVDARPAEPRGHQPAGLFACGHFGWHVAIRRLLPQQAKSWYESRLELVP